MFNFSANHLLLISRTEYPSCAVLLMQDRDTRRVYRLYDFSKALLIRPGVAYCVAGKVHRAEFSASHHRFGKPDPEDRLMGMPPVENERMVRL